jgi:hypothetical protein
MRTIITYVVGINLISSGFGIAGKNVLNRAG